MWHLQTLQDFAAKCVILNLNHMSSLTCTVRAQQVPDISWSNCLSFIERGWVAQVKQGIRNGTTVALPNLINYQVCTKCKLKLCSRISDKWKLMTYQKDHLRFFENDPVRSSVSCVCGADWSWFLNELQLEPTRWPVDRPNSCLKMLLYVVQLETNNELTAIRVWEKELSLTGYSQQDVVDLTERTRLTFLTNVPELGYWELSELPVSAGFGCTLSDMLWLLLSWLFLIWFGPNRFDSTIVTLAKQSDLN